MPQHIAEVVSLMGRKVTVETALWTGFAALMASITVFRPLPDADVCDVAQETETAAYVAGPVASTEVITESETEAEIHCTDPASAWVEKVSLDYSASDAYLLAKIAWAEARGEGTEGMALVIRVVLNRVWNPEFPNSISDVIFQEGQFSGVNYEAWNIIDVPQSAWDALALVESGWDESQGATYFCANGESEWHNNNLTRLFSYGNHVFYK